MFLLVCMYVHHEHAWCPQRPEVIQIEKKIAGAFLMFNFKSYCGTIVTKQTVLTRQR